MPVLPQAGHRRVSFHSSFIGGENAPGPASVPKQATHDFKLRHWGSKQASTPNFSDDSNHSELALRKGTTSDIKEDHYVNVMME
jgi:hypothetical protein